MRENPITGMTKLRLCSIIARFIYSGKNRAIVKDIGLPNIKADKKAKYRVTGFLAKVWLLWLLFLLLEKQLKYS